MFARQTKIRFSAAVSCLLSVMCLAVDVDSFDTYAVGQVDAVTARWKGMPTGFSSAVIETDPADAANKALRVSAVIAGSGGNGVYGILDSAAHIAESTTKTLFLRFRVSAATTNQSFGLTNVDAPAAGGSGNWTDFRVQIGLIDGNLGARDAGTMRTLTAVSPGTWYNLWVVVNNAADTFTVYLNQGDSDAAEADRMKSDTIETFAFRSGTTEALDRFLWRAQPQTVNPAIWIDDIYMMDGTALQNPLRVQAETPFSPDISRDQFVDIADAVLLADAWLEDCAPPDWCGRADLDKSGRVDFPDFGDLSRVWLSSTIPGLTAWWKLNEGSGTIAYDRLNNYNGVLRNTEPQDWDAVGDRFAVGLDAQTESDGRGEYIELPYAVQGTFTLAFWFRTTNSADPGPQWWQGKGLVSTLTETPAAIAANDFGISLLWDKAAFGVGSTTIQSSRAVNDGRWHHLAAVRNAATGQMQLYIDGVVEAAGTGPTGALNNAQQLLIGSMRLRSGQYAGGWFDDIRLYDTVLSAADIAVPAVNSYPPLTAKKGQAGNTPAATKDFAGWFYHWGRLISNKPDGVEFVPMQWGQWSLSSLVSEVTAMKQSGVANYLLGFNEPDGADQANISVARAIELWPLLMQTGLPLVSPATVLPDNLWMQSFMAEIDRLNYRVEDVAVHWYGGSSTDSLIGKLQQTYTLYGRPLWITEFAVADWSANAATPNRYTPEQVYTFMAEILWRLETLEYVKRYSWFSSKPSSYALGPSAIFNEDRSAMTELGALYAAWDGDLRGPQPKTWYFLNNKAGHRRLRAYDDSLEMATISFMGNWVQWEPVNAGNGRYFFQNRGSGKRLCFNNAANQFLLAESSFAGDDAKWALTESQHGWYFIDHPGSGKRLSRSGETAVMVSQTLSGDNERWRFIKP